MRLCTFLIVAFSCVSLSAQIIELDWILNSASVDSGFTNGDTNASFSKVIDLGNGQNGLVQLAVVSNDGLFIDSDGLGAGGDNSIDHFGRARVGSAFLLPRKKANRNEYPSHLSTDFDRLDLRHDGARLKRPGNQLASCCDQRRNGSQLAFPV